MMIVAGPSSLCVWLKLLTLHSATRFQHDVAQLTLHSATRFGLALDD